MVERKLYTDTELKRIIENEGLDYAVQWYLNADKIENEVTKRLWTKAKLALTELSEYLELED